MPLKLMVILIVIANDIKPHIFFNDTIANKLIVPLMRRKLWSIETRNGNSALVWYGRDGLPHT